MLDKSSALESIMRKSAKLSVGSGIDLRTFKRDRSVKILRESDEVYKVIEDGFHNEEFLENFKSLKKTIKKLLKREFPRSNKIRVYDI